MESHPEIDSLLEGQQVYYRERASEYDDWWERRGRFDRGPEHRSAWLAEMTQLVATLDDFAPIGDVLELAAGTGNWTQHLARHADHITALDSSPETFEISRHKLGEPKNIDYVVTDLFKWEPPRRFDVVMMGFWLTHVPDERLDDFWVLIDRSLAPDGRVLILDSAHPDLATKGAGAGYDVHYKSAAAVHSTLDVDSHRATRSLDDGREFEIVKRFWRPRDFIGDTTRRGWRFIAEETQHFFFMAHGVHD
jgi:SAM-dependent methyltransferase